MNGLSAIVRGRPDGRRPDPLRFALLALTTILVLFAVWEAILVVPEALSGPALGLDFHLYLERARSWLAGNGFYLERQLTGAPYEVGTGDALYPPSVLYLLVPATVLPAFIWWLIPATLIGYALWRHRPKLWGWAYIALAFCWPRTWQAILFGNPVIWVVAAVAAGSLWGWPYVGAFLKPTFGLFGLLGARSRSWWAALGIAILTALPLASMWFDYASALINARADAMAPDYLWGELPLVAIPLVARLARSRSARGPATPEGSVPAPSPDSEG